MQTKYFLDTNILIDLFVNDEYSEVRSDKTQIQKTKLAIKNILADRNNICVLSLNSIVTAFYILTLKNKNLIQKTATLLMQLYDNSEAFLIVNESPKAQIEALKYSKENSADFEDALQYFCAKDCGCKFIVTNDKNFPNLGIKLISTSD